MSASETCGEIIRLTESQQEKTKTTTMKNNEGIEELKKRMEE